MVIRTNNPLYPCSSPKPNWSNQKWCAVQIQKWSTKIRIFRPSILVLGLLVSMIGVPATGSSQQISVLGGPIFNDKGDISVSVMAEYSQHIQDLFSFSVGFLNEGHFDSPSKHHRDGLVGQAWIGGTDISKKVSFRLGFGPYLYFDSTTNGRNLHSVGAITSLDFQYALTDKWFLDLRGSYILASRMNTMPLFAGLGYKFDSSNVSVNKEPTRNELDLFLGFSVVNSPGSNTSLLELLSTEKMFGTTSI